MKVILIRDVTSLGQEGDVVEVSDGHARNFLFPQNLAVQATPETLQKKKEQEEAKKRTDNKAMSSAGQSAKELDGQEIVLKEKVNESGVLYAAVTSKAIAKALKDLGHKVKPDMIKISDPITELGTYTVMIELNHGFEAEVNISIEEK